METMLKCESCGASHLYKKLDLVEIEETNSDDMPYTDYHVNCKACFELIGDNESLKDLTSEVL